MQIICKQEFSSLASSQFDLDTWSFSWNCAIVVLTVCSRLLSCLKVKLCPSLFRLLKIFFQDWHRLACAASSIFPLTQANSPPSAPQHNTTTNMFYCRAWLFSVSSSVHGVLHEGQELNILISFDLKPFFHRKSFCCFPTRLVATCKVDSLLASFNNDFLLFTHL